MTKLERIAFWKQVCGDTALKPWTKENDLAGIFHRFRPHGKGVERLFEDVERGDEVLARLLPVYRHAVPVHDFIVNRPLPATRRELAEILTRHFEVLREMEAAADLGWTAALNAIFDSIQIEIVPRESKPNPGSPESNIALIVDTMSFFFANLQPIPSEVVLLREAFLSIAHDESLECLANFLMWPIYRESTSIVDPFAPSFQLWIRGAGYRFERPGVVTLYASSIVD